MLRRVISRQVPRHKAISLFHPKYYSNNNTSTTKFDKFGATDASKTYESRVLSKSILSAIPESYLFRDSLWTMLRQMRAANPRRMIVLNDDPTCCQVCLHVFASFM